MSGATETHAPVRERLGATRLVGLLAEFETAGELKDAAARMNAAGYRNWDAHSPFPIHGMDAAAGIRMTVLPWIVMAFGVAGCLTALVLQAWTNSYSVEVPGFWANVTGYDYTVSGKPKMSLPAFIPVTFELTVLFSALSAGIGMLVLNNLPMFYQPLFRSARFRRVTSDRFFISVEATDPKFHRSETESFLRGLHPSAVETIEDPLEHPTGPSYAKTVGISLACLALIPLAIVWYMRNNKSSEPRIHIVQDMDNQERFKAQQASTLFADGRAMRPPVGATSERPLGITVARGELRSDEAYYTGLKDGQFVTSLPSGHFAVDAALLERGRNRFEIFCSTCHGMDGRGGGRTNLRALELGGGWVQASDLTDDERRARPVGHIFNSITNGIRNMGPYGDRIPETDRWAIVAYVRALQRSANGVQSDVPADLWPELQKRKPE